MLLDTASLYFRAFFGVPSIEASDGTPVNAARGLVDFITRLIRTYEPSAVVCCWDNDWRPQWRVALVPSYKAHRVADEGASNGDVEQVPEALLVQVPIIEQTLAALGLPVIGVDGYEADDVIGTLATDAGRPVDVVTGDRDLFQLVDDAADVRVIYVARGVSNAEVVDASWIRAKYGVEPSQYADFATLRGDTSDGLSGVAGVGEKTAAGLLARHGSLSAILAAARDPESGLAASPRRRILAAADYLSPAAEVVRVARDLPIPREQIVELPREFTAPERNRLDELARRYNLSGPLERLTDLLEDR
ncbi:MAG: 5'-3' exonuclease [Nocardioides sp.]